MEEERTQILFYSMNGEEREMSRKELDVLLEEVERMNREIKPIAFWDGTEGMSHKKDIALKIKLFHLLAWVRFLLENKVIEDRQVEVPNTLNKELFNTTLKSVCNAVIHRDKDHAKKVSVLSKEGGKKMNVYFVKTDINRTACFEVGCLIETLKKA